jgi:RecB family exonuclease
MSYGRQRNIFDPKSEIPFKLSRSRLENFTKCPRCFYIDRRLGIGQPSGPPFTLNNAVDELLKKEFDILRENGEAHALCVEYGVDAVPFKDDRMDEWRDSLRRGIQYLHEPTNLLICGGVDDVWVKPDGELIIVDYKATSKNGEIEWDDNAQHHKQYKRQMEIYQWLFRKNGFKVSDTGYFVYVNGQTERDGFHGKLEFTAKLLPHTGDDSWVEQTVIDAHKCLMSETMPEFSPMCEFCQYRQATAALESVVSLKTVVEV